MSAIFFIEPPKAIRRKQVIVHDDKSTTVFRLYRSGDLILKWSGKDKQQQPPAIGQEITITMNGIGRAIVKGYFAEDGYLGVMTEALNPPKWLREQRERDRKDPRHADKPRWWKDGIGCEFGAEIEY